GTVAATAVATDAAGNPSAASAAVTTTKDTVAPAAPAVTSLPTVVNGANASSIGLSGTTEPGSSVLVTISDGTHKVTPSTIADNAGHWALSSVDVRSLADGTLSATAVATDAAGNPSAVSAAATSTKDPVAPAKPVVVSMTSSVRAADASSIALSGTAEPGSSVVVTISD